MLVKVSSKLQKLSKLFPNDLFVVGGYVRNYLLGLTTNDVDLASNMTVEKVVKILENTEYVVKVKNPILGTAVISCGSESYEYACFRQEITSDDGSHTPLSVKFCDDIETDAKRRDFTINAIYYNIKKNEIIDFFQGVIDIQQRVIRAVGDPDHLFKGDGLRILRMVRFASELGFKIEKRTYRSAKKNISTLKNISGDKKYSEIVKIFESGQKYYKDYLPENRAILGLEKLNDMKVGTYFGLPCNKIKFDMAKKVQNFKYGLLIDIIDTVNPVCLEHFLDDFLSYLKISRKKITLVTHVLSAYYEALYKLDNKTYFFRYFDCFPEVRILLLAKSKKITQKYSFFYNYIISHKLAISEKDLKINGQDIQENFSNLDKKAYPKVLEELLSKVFDGEVQNTKKDLIEYLKMTIK